MSSIVENLAKILSSRYGKDVRQAIHDSIHDCYEDGKAGATDLIAREEIEATNTRISNIIAQSGTSDTEVVDAREDASGTVYTTIKDRMDAEDARIDLGLYIDESGYICLKEA